MKRRIFGLNAAELYGIEPDPGRCNFSRADLQQAREAMPGPSRTYGPETAAELRSLIAAHGVL